MTILNTFRALDRDKRRNFSLLFSIGLLFWTSLTSLLPILPVYIEDIGGTTTQIGLVMGSFAIGLIGSRTWLGYLADGHSRKLVVRIGMLITALAPIGYLLVKSVYLLIAIRTFHGISLAAFTTGYSALITDLSPIKQRGKLIGYMSLGAPVGMAVGPAMGTFLKEYQGYQLFFLISAGIGFWGYLLASQIRENPRHRDINVNSTISEVPPRNFKQLLSSPSILVPTIVLLLIGLVFGTLIVFLPLFLRETAFGLSPGLFYTTVAVASFIVRVISGQASDRYGRGLFITISLVSYVVSMGFLTKAQSARDLLLGAIFEGIGAGMLIPMMISLISDRSFPSERGLVYSVCMGGFDLGLAIAGPILGILGQTISYRSMFALAGSLAIIAMILFISQSNKSLKHSLSFALGQERDLYSL
ncbi:MFS transporter [Cyanobacterium sp. uoEpiScrs1]|uniref:MFS transporter n=1 Tax=Cyanobacterium sp. uoEpiScrs1 TaxID=2976343 RepID=UPI00226AF5F7|nr:MFS transporter [Cyanobacterium sp. uoEpiScrs1]